MKNIKHYFILLSLFIVIVFYIKIIPYNKIIIQAIVFSFIPSLFPCLILTNLIIENDTLIFLYNRLKNNWLTRKIYVLILILISSVLGMPSLQQLIIYHYTKGIIDRNSCDNFIYSFGCISFPFLYGVCLINCNLKPALMILGIFYFINIINLIGNFKLRIIDVKEENNRLLSSFINSIKKSITTIGIIAGTIMFFSLPLFILDNLPYPVNCFFEGLIEFSYPCLKASQSKTMLGEIIVLFISLFPSLSIIIQSKIINKALDIKKYILNRLVLAIIGCAIYFLLRISF